MAKQTEEKPEEQNPEDEPVTLTKAELQKMLDDNRAEASEAAIKEEREKRKAAEKEKRRREREQRGEDEEEEEPEEVIKRAEARAAEAEQRAAEAERKALMGEVNIKLRDYLTANFREFVGNAPDIILHIERALPAGEQPTEQAIARLIEAHSKQFVERTKAARGSNQQQPVITRSKISGVPQEQRENKTLSREQQPTRPFSAINWHG